MQWFSNIKLTLSLELSVSLDVQCFSLYRQFSFSIDECVSSSMRVPYSQLLNQNNFIYCFRREIKCRCKMIFIFRPLFQILSFNTAPQHRESIFQHYSKSSNYLQTLNKKYWTLLETMGRNHCRIIVITHSVQLGSTFEVKRLPVDITQHNMDNSQ